MNDLMKDAYGKIHAEEALKEKTRNYIKNKTAAHNSFLSVFACSKRTFNIAAACFMMVIVLAGGAFSYLTPVTSINIDVNPSIEMGVNIFNRVVGIKGYNEDGIQLASALKVKNMSSLEAVENIMNSNEFTRYLKQDSYLAVTVSGNNAERREELRLCIEKSEICQSQNVHCFTADNLEVEAARREGLSIGKYRAYLELKKYDPSVKPEEINEMTMRQIYNQIEKLSGKQVDFGGHGKQSGHGGGNRHK